VRTDAVTDPGLADWNSRNSFTCKHRPRPEIVQSATCL